MDKYFIYVIILVALSIFVILYIKIRAKTIYDSKEGKNNTDGDNFTLLE